MGFGPRPAVLHPGCSTVQVVVDVATGVLLRFDEVTDDGPITTRSLSIVEVDEPIDAATFELPAQVEATKDARSRQRFDSPQDLAANVGFSVYELHPAPTTGMVLCLRHSISSAEISYFPAVGTLSQSGSARSQPIMVRSGTSTDADSPSEEWVAAEVRGRPARVWTIPNNAGFTSHIRISFEEGNVLLTCEHDQAEALRLAGTLRRVAAS